MATIEYLNTNSSDMYSDGTQVELDILNYIREYSEEEYSTLFSKDDRWAVFYHLSDMRKNILSWYDFQPGSDVLEIGGGMGAITGLLCQRAGSVTTVELSERRASAIYERHKNCNNLNILVGNFNKIDFQKKYDYITLIGVLEYAKGFVSSGKAEDFLEKIKSLLKPGGKLLIAIENRFGLKYWCGASEDHLVKPYVGINGYKGEDRIQTYSRSELDELLKNSGFVNTRFFYPLPDYKFPQAVFSDQWLPSSRYSKSFAYYYIQTPYLMVNEDLCFREAVKNGAFPFMANSFFVECSTDDTAELSNVIFSSFTSERIPSYRIITKIRADKTVEKSAANPDAVAHLDKIIENQKQFKSENIIPYRKKNDHLEMDFIEGQSLTELLREALKKQDVSKAKALFEKLSECIVSSASRPDPETKLLPVGFLDMTTSNCFVIDGKFVFFDQEWVLENVSPRFILYRALRYFFSENPDISTASAASFFGLFGFTIEELTNFQEMEKQFLDSVCPDNTNPLMVLWSYNAIPRTFDETLHKIEVLQQQYDTISNAKFWKISEPLRKMLDQMKARKRQSGKLILLKKGYNFYRTYGLRAAIKRTRGYLGKYKSKKTKKGLINAYSDKNEMISDLQPLGALPNGKKIAVHVHLYYEDLLEEFCKYLDNIPFQFDLYVSVKRGADLAKIRERMGKIANAADVTAEYCENRGRDIAPLFVQFGKEIAKYDYFLHIHTKKSLYTGSEQKKWRRYSIDSLVGNEETVRKIIGLLEDHEKNVGMVFPETQDFSFIALSWLKNKAVAEGLLNSIDMEMEDMYFNYPTGSFFWAKTESLLPLFKRNLTLYDFPEEAGQIDGTLAHALERAVAVVARTLGYHLAIIDKNDGVVRYDVSLKLFDHYFSLSAESALQELEPYDLVSFDIFDTLISRKVFCPDDVFRLIGNRIENEFKMKVDFLKVRKLAEKIAWGEKGAFTTIDDIYHALPLACRDFASNSEVIKNWEIEAEKDFCMPRKDMVWIYKHLRELGKRIILVSDMYLPGSILSDLLAANNIVGYEDLWVSCDKGMRKDDTSIWNAFFSKYGNAGTVHVGDNPCSDAQIVGDFKRAFFLIMNPAASWKMTRMNFELLDFAKENRTVEVSVVLGLVIQNRLFNSPFVQKKDGQILVEDPEDFGYVAFGPIFSYFTEWLLDKTAGKKKLFLAREGYVFKQFFDLYCSIFGISNGQGVYFLTSRRAASLASVRNWDDIKNILMMKYNGPFDNLVKERIGIDISEKELNKDIVLPTDIQWVMKQLQPYMKDILSVAEKERENYLAYIGETVGSLDNAALIDIGYAGTIQYFLSLLTEKKLDGYYLAVNPQRSPEKLGCLCEAAFPLDSWADMDQNVIIKHQQFLESVLKAPFGQLLFFEKNDAGVSPKYKDDITVSEGTARMIKGALEYANDYWNIAKKYSLKYDNCKEIASKLLDYMLSGDIMGKQIGELFSFHDEYCSNGSFQYNADKNEFELKHNNVKAP